MSLQSIDQLNIARQFQSRYVYGTRLTPDISAAAQHLAAIFSFQIFLGADFTARAAWSPTRRVGRVGGVTARFPTRCGVGA
jgi:hypothetical protein